MHDITQSLGNTENVRFTANSNEADVWMRDHYGDIDISLPPEEALLLKKAATKAGLAVQSL